MKLIFECLFGFIIFFTDHVAQARDLDYQTFYSSREHQIFKSEDIRKSSVGYIKGDDVQYLTWEGFISGNEVYFELHGEKIKIITKQKEKEFSLRQAPALSGGNQEYFVISDARSDFFIKSTPNPLDALICIESLGQDIYIHPIPYWEVYLITNPIFHPQLYRLSGINASCKGIERTSFGELIAPLWSIQKDFLPNVAIDYYQINASGFRKSNERVTGSLASEDAQTYLMDE